MNHTLLVVLALLLNAFVGKLAGAAADDPLALPPEVEAELAVDVPMHEDPALQGPDRRIEFHPRLEELWRAALARPEIDLRRQAVDAIGRAFALGHIDLARLAPTLTGLVADDPHPLVRLTAAEALIRMEQDAAAPALFEANRDGLVDMVLLTDPALARWRYGPAADLWLKRLGDDAVPPVVRHSAIRSLGASGDLDSIGPLLALAGDRAASSTLRLVAAEAVGRLATTDRAVLDAARQLQRGAMIDRLVGARLLRANLNVEDPAVHDLLVDYAQDAEDAVAAEALDQLAESAPRRVLGLTPAALDRADANARYAAVRALHLSDAVEAIEPLARALDDPDPRTRRYARYALMRLDADASKRQAVRAAANDMLDSASWRGLEQASLLLGRVDHEPAAPRLIELLTHERAETRIAAAAALRALAVSDALGPMLDHATMLAGSRPAADTPPSHTLATSQQLVELFQAFGQTGYAPAEPLMRSFIPKDASRSAESRGAAIWALGKLHADSGGGNLAAPLQARLSDLNPMNPESTEVRSQAAIALGRMKARGALQVLRRFNKEENVSREIGGATRWAIEQISGQTQPPLETVVERPMDWFLRPAD